MIFLHWFIIRWVLPVTILNPVLILNCGLINSRAQCDFAGGGVSFWRWREIRFFCPQQWREFWVDGVS